MNKASIFASFINEGLLSEGQQVLGSTPGIAAVITSDGLQYAGSTYADPTTAMQAALKAAHLEDNGWIYWKVDDAARGFFKPLEHVRVASAAMKTPGSHAEKTSDSHPLRIDSLKLDHLPGSIGMTFFPGKKGDALYGGAWRRDLIKDLAVIRDWGAGAVVTLLEDHEFALLGTPEFPEVMQQQPFQWIYLNIKDSNVPDSRFEEAWPKARQQIRQMLLSGKGVVFHCRGGLGRTGLVVARFLVEEGALPAEAIELVRQVRPGTIETWEQENYVRLCSP